MLLIAAVLIALIAALVHQPSTSGSTSGTGAASDDRPLETNITHGLISDAVVAYRDVVADYAEQNGISEYTDVLLAIMQVESGGELDDLMQSSDSLELPSDSLQQEASIRQGCSYFAHLLHRAESESCDLDTVIQAYNYGSGFIDYVAEHGGKYTLELSEKFAQQQSGGATVPYDNPIAVKRNDGWRYAYGNMFYAKLVNQQTQISLRSSAGMRKPHCAIAQSRPAVFRVTVLPPVLGPVMMSESYSLPSEISTGTHFFASMSG